ncbi:D12 class N6 adenine-specific DNA methyltransferase [Thalassoglobus neptunius]|uniref:D12 class N6 adenine-specific DNA methyltransferase n=1 Tax=Thalassoglobus neptunius TaxID=1938619 RepID=A0A5C5X4N4_9PLAN|nr:DNA adenine methylase [Thalassoglobus neptunius]TWT57688.1 D12 class N6 adenine-specific DNA methyltransferase [Thalassoglobus neptunius]
MSANTPCHRSAQSSQLSNSPVTRRTTASDKKLLRCPFPYFGGKSSIVPIVNERFGEITALREPFAGSAALTLAREPVAHEALNDVNHYIVNFWRAIKSDPESVAEHAHHPVTEADLHARSTYLFRGDAVKGAQHRIAQDPEYFDPRLAGWYAWGKSCQIANAFEGVQKSKPSMRGNGVCVPVYRTQRARQLALIDWFGALAERLHNVRILYGDWQRLVSAPSSLGLFNKNSISGIFLDPPYAHSLARVQQLLGLATEISDPDRGRTDCYLCDDDKSQVDQLVADVNHWCQQSGSNPRLRIALCGYSGEHDNLVSDHSWTKHSWTTHGGWANTSKKTDTRGKENKSRETIWFSPGCVGE